MHLPGLVSAAEYSLVQHQAGGLTRERMLRELAEALSERAALPAKIAADAQVAVELGKPFLIGEAGIAAPTPMYSFSRDERAALFDAKLAAHFSGTTDGFLVWSFYDLSPVNWQGWDFAPQDPLSTVLAKWALTPP